ncbi:hypothetical protein T484DRAFT_2794536 [Baffinella frigidus]|nr:hypothetical protein T484DRAFT_2794536 [Cryptophyta sp. CCMP2293]
MSCSLPSMRTSPSSSPSRLRCPRHSLTGAVPLEMAMQQGPRARREEGGVPACRCPTLCACHKVVGDVPAGRIVKRLRVARAPPVLCLHLKRVIPTLSGFRKDRTPVVFGPTLSLAPFVETFQQGDDEAPASKGTDDGKGPRYQLVAMVEHIGDAYSGHYICYARGSVGGGLNERWRLHNDSDSRDITLRDVLRREAYILVYDRVDV